MEPALTSLAKIWISHCRACSSRNSSTVMAIEYASSPEEHPVTHIRTVDLESRFLNSSGKTFVLSARKASGSRSLPGTQDEGLSGTVQEPALQVDSPDMGDGMLLR